MADTLCGPSNPLQSFKNHSQVDRSLQQDRLTGARHPPAQGFRTPDPRAASLDAEFAAFEAGPQQPFHLQQQPLLAYQNFRAGRPISQSLGQDVHLAPGWAADFQNLYVGSAQYQPIPQNQFRSEAPLMRSNTGRDASRWHDDLMQQQQQHSVSNVDWTQPTRSQMAGFGNLQGQPTSQYQSAQQQRGLHHKVQYPAGSGSYQNAHVEVAHRAAFEAAFAQAEGVYTPQQRDGQLDQSNAMEVAGVRLDPIFNAQPIDLKPGQLSGIQFSANRPFQTGPDQHTNIAIGSDVIPYNDRQLPRTSEQNSRDADELARTADQLLNSMSHETSSKFEQSQFLGLMRRIRDREVEVQGEEFRETKKSADTTRNVPPLGEVPEARVGPEFQAQRSRVAEYHQSAREAEVENQRDPPQDAVEAQPAEAKQQLATTISGNNRRQEEMQRQTRNKADRLLGDDAQALHPGGKGYPVGPGLSVEDDDRHRYDHWASGGIGVEDERMEESAGLAARFGRVSVADQGS